MCTIKILYRCLSALILLPLLGGCGSPFLFGPAKVGTSEHFEYFDKSADGLGSETFAALYDRDQGAASVAVGWEHFYEPGEHYTRIHNHIYRGAVKFNVGLVSEPPPKTVTRATLNYRIENGGKSPGSGFIESCASKLYLAKDEWHAYPEVSIDTEVSKVDTIAGDLYKDGLPENLVGSTASIDVTDAVKDWVVGRKKNFGFVFGAAKEVPGHPLPYDNNKCWTILGDFTLKIEYTRP